MVERGRLRLDREPVRAHGRHAGQIGEALSPTVTWKLPERFVSVALIAGAGRADGGARHRDRHRGREIGGRARTEAELEVAPGRPVGVVRVSGPRVWVAVSALAVPGGA